MKYVDLVQGTANWIRWRRGGLGASDAAAVMGVSPFPEATPLNLWLRLTGQAPSIEETFAMRRGTRLEPLARNLYQQQTGRQVFPVCGAHDRLAWMRASLDGINVMADLVVEIKAPNFKAHGEALSLKVPDYYWPQVQHQLYVAEVFEADYVSYSENKKFSSAQQLAIVPVKADPAYQARLVNAEADFWRCVVERRRPGSSIAC